MMITSAGKLACRTAVFMVAGHIMFGSQARVPSTYLCSAAETDHICAQMRLLFT